MVVVAKEELVTIVCLANRLQFKLDCERGGEEREASFVQYIMVIALLNMV